MADCPVSIVSAVFNGEKTIAATLRGILEQDVPLLEVIVIDDGSTDNTPQIVQSFPGIKYFFQPNQGPASARNKGAELASGEILLFTDSDCIPEPGWVRKIIPYFADPSVGVSAGSYGIANPGSILARSIHKEIIYRHTVLMPVYPKVFGSYNFAIRKNLFRELGGFNTVYRSPSGEDNDLSYKVIQAGYKIYFARDSIVKHYHPTSLLKYLREQYRHGFWRFKMYQDYPAMMRGDDYTFWKDALEVPVAFLSFLIFFSFPLHHQIPLLAAAAFCVFLLGLMELYYGFVITHDIVDGYFFSLVMWLRAFARSFGSSSGFLYFSCLKRV